VQITCPVLPLPDPMVLDWCCPECFGQLLKMGPNRWWCENGQCTKNFMGPRELYLRCSRCGLSHAMHRPQPAFPIPMLPAIKARRKKKPQFPWMWQTEPCA
jgi:hypothetical protein